jgi:DNA-binding MarR family transcriptional regulator
VDDPPDETWVTARSRHGLEEVLREVLDLAARVRPALGRRLNLSAAEVLALEHLGREQIGPVELSRRLGLTSAAATVLVHRLEGAGHLDRQPHPQDGRRTVLSATPEARRRSLEQVRPMIEGFDAAAAKLTPEQRLVVGGYLADVVLALRAVVDPAADGTEPDRNAAETENE